MKKSLKVEKHAGTPKGFRIRIGFFSTPSKHEYSKHEYFLSIFLFLHYITTFVFERLHI